MTESIIDIIKKMTNLKVLFLHKTFKQLGFEEIHMLQLAAALETELNITLIPEELLELNNSVVNFVKGVINFAQY